MSIGKLKDFEQAKIQAEAQVSYYISLHTAGEERVKALEEELLVVTKRLNTLKRDIEKAPKMIAYYQNVVVVNTRKVRILRESGSTFEPLSDKEKGLRKLKRMQLEIEELKKEVFGE